VHSDFRDKLRNAVRRPSLAGDGLPERMRSTVVAFLGLTAAAGLALVAIFAQLGFPVLTPAPLPSAPTKPGSVARAVPLKHGSPSAAIAQSQSVAPASGGFGARGASETAARGQRGSAGVDGSAVPVSSPPAADSPDPGAPTPAPAPETAPVPAPTPAATTEPAPAPVEVPVSSPGTGEQPSPSKPVTSRPNDPEPEPAPSKPTRPHGEPKPTKPTKPVKPEPRPEKPEAAPATGPKYVPAPAPVVEETGKDKEKGKKDK